MTNIALILAALCTALLVLRSVRQTPPGRTKVWVSWVGTLVGAGLAALAYNLEVLGPWRLMVVGLFGGSAATMALLDFPDSDSPAALGAPIGLCAVLLGFFA